MRRKKEGSRDKVQKMNEGKETRDKGRRGGQACSVWSLCLVERALLYSSPAETRLTVYRRLDMMVSCMLYEFSGREPG